MMDNNKRPESMERITTPELAEAFIEEQVALVKEQVGEDVYKRQRLLSYLKRNLRLAQLPLRRWISVKSRLLFIFAAQICPPVRILIPQAEAM